MVGSTKGGGHTHHLVKDIAGIRSKSRPRRFDRLSAQSTFLKPKPPAWFSLGLFAYSTSFPESADPLPPVPASCRGDRRGMQLEVIGIKDSPWKARPNAQKVDSQDHSRDRSRRDRSWDQSWDPGCCFRLLVVSRSQPKQVLGPVLGPVLGLVPARTGTEAGPGPGVTAGIGSHFKLL